MNIMNNLFFQNTSPNVHDILEAFSTYVDCSYVESSWSGNTHGTCWYGNRDASDTGSPMASPATGDFSPSSCAIVDDGYGSTMFEADFYDYPHVDFSGCTNDGTGANNFTDIGAVEYH